MGGIHFEKVFKIDHFLPWDDRIAVGIGGRQLFWLSFRHDAIEIGGRPIRGAGHIFSPSFAN
jgi:hypothetical protein